MIAGLYSGVQSTDFSRVFWFDLRNCPTEVGTLNACIQGEFLLYAAFSPAHEID
jgi:hypothetical protein